ncbi:hypothetical protein BT96DRAFT_1003583 [Gymnopus androsaceus JB14]|uniref:Uncharacterized protein n=1 Tax=Gymnopus androsaceus JB14 TaxID=1447944 RepID=A0A6A4GUI3_9AGAR|nr:hypothetical protein BT96DRAFT_1003583 [Gymnopus androsaceus JB14]
MAEADQATSGHRRRLRAIEDAIAEGDRVMAKKQALLRDEKARQEAEENLNSLTQKVDDGVEEVSYMLQCMDVSAVELRESLMRAKTPTLASPVNSPPITPSRPRATAVASPSPSRPPRGTTLTQTKHADPVYPGAKFPAYVVYQGKGGTHGVFYAWSTYKSIKGAKDFYDHQMHHHVVRSFTTRALAERFYEEFCASGIPELLQEQEPSADEHFIIVEGVKPMVCATRKQLIMDALQYCGGVVYRFIGELGTAWVIFNQFERDGLVKCIHEPCNFF